MMKNEKRQSRSIAMTNEKRKRLKGRTRKGRRTLGMVISEPESETLQRRSNG